MLNDDCTRPGRTRKGRFAKIPDFLQTDARLVGCDLRLLARLIHYAWDSGVCWPSVRRLASDLSVSERTIQVALKRLYSLGYVASRPASNPTGRELVLKLDGVTPPAPSSPPPPAPSSPAPAAPELEPVPIQQTRLIDSRVGLPGTERELDSIVSPATMASPPCVAVGSERPQRPAPAPTSPRRRAGRMTGEELAEMTRALAAAGDPAAQRELARLERPKPRPVPPPISVEELIDRLDDDPTYRPRLASALANQWGDRKSYEFYWGVAMRAPRDVIARAFAGCQAADSPPAMFTALICRDPAFDRRGPRRR